MMELAIRHGVVLIDECDLELVSAHSWTANAPDKTLPNSYYAHTRIYSPITKQQSTLWMHRLITGAANGQQVDHRDHNGLNNCRSNLRLCTQALNNAARRIGATPSGYRGVIITRHGRYRASITSAKRSGAKMINLGTFADATAAARAYDVAALERFGEFATLNFPQAA